MGPVTDKIKLQCVPRRSFRSYNRAFDLTVSSALKMQRSAHFKAVLDDSLITLGTTSLDQQKLYYCTIALKVMMTPVMVLIWKFARDMRMISMTRKGNVNGYHAINNAINTAN